MKYCLGDYHCESGGAGHEHVSVLFYLHDTSKTSTVNRIVISWWVSLASWKLLMWSVYLGSSTCWTGPCILKSSPGPGLSRIRIGADLLEPFPTCNGEKQDWVSGPVLFTLLCSTHAEDSWQNSDCFSGIIVQSWDTTCKIKIITLFCLELFYGMTCGCWLAALWQL